MRTDAVAVILEVVAWMRQLDPRLKVTWEPGWERLGNGLAARYVGGIVHDTTTPSSPARPFPTQNLLRVGRPDLSGPIANFGGPYCTVDAPWIHVTAAFPANHAGASGGRSMGPLPKTSLFNPTVLGLEIDFSGLVLMPAGQMYVGHLWARAVADVLAGGNLEYVRAHFETSVTGKIDISYAPGKSYDMAAFRRDAANLTSLQEDTVSMEDVVQSWYGPRFKGDRNYAQVIHNIENQVTAANAQIAGQTAALNALAQAVASGRDDLTAEELTAAVDEGIRRGGAAVLAAQEAARASAGSRPQA